MDACARLSKIAATGRQSAVRTNSLSRRLAMLDSRPLWTALIAAGLLAGGAASAARLQLEQAELFFELNDTDGDLGIHAAIDGGPYTKLEIDDPNDETILSVTAKGRLGKQGLTELDFESAELPFDELSPGAFFRRFPEGEYEIEITRGKKELEETVELSHVLAAPPSNVRVSGKPAAESCDATPLPTASEPVLVDWDPVTTSHPEIGDDGPVEIVRYQFFVEQDDVSFGVDLPPEVTEFEVPTAITSGGGTFKFEIIARTAELNNTAIESCFVVP
jgi:hypothetical protein